MRIPFSLVIPVLSFDRIDDVSDVDIVELNIPTGIPLIYELDERLKPINNYYL